MKEIKTKTTLQGLKRRRIFLDYKWKSISNSTHRLSGLDQEQGSSTWKLALHDKRTNRASPEMGARSLEL